MTPQRDQPDFYKLTQDVAYMRATTESMHHRLFGNGKIGVVEEFDLRITAIEQARAEERVRKATLKWVGHTLWILLAAAWGLIMAQAPLVKELLRRLGW